METSHATQVSARRFKREISAMSDTRGIPPGGFTGAGQQTQAARVLFESAVGGRRRPVRRKKRRVTKKKTRPKSRKTRTVAKRRKRAASKRKPARLIKGSAAAKRHMAKLRRMQKRKR